MSKRKTAASDDRTQREEIVSKAVLKAAERLGVQTRQLAEVLGVSEPSLSRMRKGAFHLDYHSKSYELALLLLRLFRSLDALLGGDVQSMQSWMICENSVLRAKPMDLIVSICGLMETVGYIDSRRAVI